MNETLAVNLIACMVLRRTLILFCTARRRTADLASVAALRSAHCDTAARIVMTFLQHMAAVRRIVFYAFPHDMFEHAAKHSYQPSGGQCADERRSPDILSGLCVEPRRRARALRLLVGVYYESLPDAHPPCAHDRRG